MVSLKCVCLLGTNDSLIALSFIVKQHRNNVKQTLLNYRQLFSWYFKNNVYFDHIFASNLIHVLVKNVWTTDCNFNIVIKVRYIAYTGFGAIWFKYITGNIQQIRIGCGHIATMPSPDI